MTCADMGEVFELYALGLLEHDERGEIDRHLDSGCPVCTRALSKAVATNAIVMSFAPEATPSRRLRKRLLASVGGRSTSWGWMLTWATATAALLVATVWFGSTVNQRNSELAAARRQVLANHAQLDRAQEILQFLNQPDTRQVGFGAPQRKPPRGNVFVNPRRGVMLIAGNLPAVPAGKTYEMWIVPKGGAPKPAGLFSVDERGNAIHFSEQSVDIAATGAVAISVEPETGSAAPTTTPIVVAPLTGP